MISKNLHIVGANMIKLPKKILASSMLGGMVEFYDFTIYGFFAPIIGPLFFPSHDALVSTLLGYAVFAVGFILRPLGAMFFGNLGDKIGRKKGLCLSLFLMAFATGMMGILPTYAEWGIYASFLMIVARILQGLSAGGEYSGGIIFAVEHSPSNAKGRAGSIVVAGCMSGVFLGALASYLCSLPFLSGCAWGWRIPFLLGFFISIIGLYIRTNTSESVEFKRSKIIENPLSYGIKNYPYQCIAAVGIAAFSGVFYPMLSMFMPTYLTKVLGMPLSQAKLFSLVMTVTMVSLIPVFGAISDKLGRPLMMRLSAILVSVLIFPYLWSLEYFSFMGILASGMCVTCVVAMFMGCMNTYILEIFPVNVRYSCFGFFYSIGMGIFGGTAPMIGMYILSLPFYSVIFGGYLLTGCLLGVGGVFLSKKSGNVKFA